MVRKRSHMAWKAFSSSERSAGASVGKLRIASTSKCAMKNSGLALRSTTAPTPSSTATSSAKRPSSRKSSSVIRLIGGLSIVANATRSATSTRIRW
jgi:hypothetical protein